MAKKRFRQSVLILLGMIIAVFVAIDNWLPYSLLSHYKRPVDPHPQILAKYNASADPIQFTTSDSTKVSGWWIPTKPQAPTTLVLLHGLGGTRQDLLEFSLPLWKTGMNLALIDLRGHGETSGEFFTYGFHEWQDVSGLIDHLQSSHGVQNVALMGVSAGGAVAISSAAHDPRIQALVTIGAFADLGQMIERRSLWLPSLWRERAKARAEQMAQFSIRETSTLSNIQKITCPVLIAHGTADTYIPYEDAQNLYRNAKLHKTLYSIQNADHGDMLWKNRKELQAQITRFLSAVNRA